MTDFGAVLDVHARILREQAADRARRDAREAGDLTAAAMTRPEPDDQRCPDCAVAVDVAHVEGCDVARCLHTGMQRLTCDFVRAEDAIGDHDCGADVWTGRWPGLVDCEDAGWWQVDGRRVPAGTPGASHDLNRLNPLTAKWDRETKRWVERV